MFTTLLGDHFNSKSAQQVNFRLSSSNFLLKNPFLTSKINICPVGGGKNP